jgi:type III secretory pathway component EscU
MASENGQARPYVDICHRSSLLYAFAAILLAKFVEISQLPSMVETVAVSAVLLYFASAIFTFFIDGLLQDTDNQLKPPFHVGKASISSKLISVHMWMLIAAEVLGFLVLFYGVIVALI